MFPVYDENETEKPPIINNWLIAINIVVALFQCMLVVTGCGAQLTAYMEVPIRCINHFSPREFATICTSMFMHSGLGHLFGNMWMLYLFGDNVEDRLGHRNYLLFYLGCGILAALAHIISDPSSSTPLLGASGAIAGVMAAYLVLYPGVKIKTWIFGIWGPRVPAWFIIGGWFVLQLAATAMLDPSDNIAYFAHIGGFAAGIALLHLFSFNRANNTEHQADTVFASAKNKPNCWQGALVACLFLGAVGYSIHGRTERIHQATLPAAEAAPTFKKQSKGYQVTASNMKDHQVSNKRASHGAHKKATHAQRVLSKPLQN
jgi:membrane associated rhomboid family serine protease